MSKGGVNIKRSFLFIILSIACLIQVGCHVNDEFQTELEKVTAPKMSLSILDADETAQLEWLSDISRFAIATMQSKTADLTGRDLKTVRRHLSQVFGLNMSERLAQGFYSYDEESGTYYVPDGDWGMYFYDSEWPASEIIRVERTEDSAALVLRGLNWFEDPVSVRYNFSISDESFRLQKGEGVGMGEGVYVRPLNVVLYSSNLFQEHDVQERPELVPPPDNCKIIKEGSVPSHL